MTPKVGGWEAKPKAQAKKVMWVWRAGGTVLVEKIEATDKIGDRDLYFQNKLHFTPLS